MTRFEFFACLAGAILLGIVLHFVLPLPTIPNSHAPWEQQLLPASTGTPSQPYWDFRPEHVRNAVTPELINALCPPYSTLIFFEDSTYECVPG